MESFALSLVVGDIITETTFIKKERYTRRIMNIYIKHALLYCLMFCTALFTACSDDEDGQTPLAEGQGEVVFAFERNNVYSITTLEEMVRLKVTLEKDGETVILPTFDLTGDEQSRTSEPVRLDNGTYLVKKYVAYNNKGVQVMEAYLDTDNQLTVQHGELTKFYFPVTIRITYSNNLLRSALFGICTEIFGNDSTLWPKTWREENDDFLTWENLHFETDDYGNILYLSEVVFDEKFAANPETGFAGMKKLPLAVFELPTVQGIVIRDIPEFEELPGDKLATSGIGAISIINTSLSALPRQIGSMKYLTSLSVINGKLAEIPVELKNATDMFAADFSGNQLTTFPAEVAKNWQKLVSLNLANNQITSLPAELFSMKKVSTFDFHNNPGLSSLPETRGEGVAMAGLLLNDCGFTAIPEIAKTPGIRLLAIANNKIASVSNADMGGDWRSLDLSGNPITNALVLSHEHLQELKLNNCNLLAVPDVANLPELRALYLTDNRITTVPAGSFASCHKLTILSLENNSTLTSIDNTAFYTTDKGYELTEGKDWNALRPINLHAVDVDNCSNLTWKIPAEWNHLPSFYVTNKEGLHFGDFQVVVYHKGANKVTREAVCTELVKHKDEPVTAPYTPCTKNHDSRPVKNFDEWKEENLKN